MNICCYILYKLKIDRLIKKIIRQLEDNENRSLLPYSEKTFLYEPCFVEATAMLIQERVAGRKVVSTVNTAPEYHGMV